MKKLFLTFGAIIIVFFGLIIVFPSLFYSFSLGQKIILRFEGDRAAHFYFSKNGSTRDTLYIEGVIYSGTLDDFTEIVEKYPEINTLSMVEVPGSIDDEINVLVSREIRKKDINTYIPENGWVASGGTDMFLAGKERRKHSNTKIGVHSWGGEKIKATEYPRDHNVHKKYLEYYQDIEIDSDFYWYTLEVAPAEKMHWMTEEEISLYNVISSKLDLFRMLAIQEELSSDKHAGRKSGENDLAQKLIADYFEENKLLSFNSDYRHNFSFTSRRAKKEIEATNIIGFVDGSVYPDEYFVIGAHFDHLGIRNDSIYNGADDNASGTAAMMVLANYFADNSPEHSIIFAAFDAEEMGLQGSRNFVDHPPVELSKIILNINLDMLSYNPANEIYVVGTHQFPEYKPLIEEISEKGLLTVSYGHDDPHDRTKDYWMNSSDNGPFNRKGIPNITFSEEDHKYYHTPGDDYKIIHKAFYKDVANFVLEAIEKFDKDYPYKN